MDRQNPLPGARPATEPRRATGGALRRVLAAALLVLALPAHPADPPLEGRRAVVALTREQQRIPIGSVQFDPRPDGTVRFTLHIDHAPFRDHFLSMKEFKCLEGPGELACHVPYPYPSPRTVTAGDLSWLEHELLFLYKLPSEFGAKLWNGLYFKLERSERGLRGRPQAIDLNRISAPPDKPGMPPYRPVLRDDIAPGARWIEALTIE